MLREILRWWMRQMLELVPRRLLPDPDRQDALLVSVEGDDDAACLCLQLRRNRREIDLGRFQLNDDGMQAAATAISRRRSAARAVALRLDPDFVLDRRVVLPMAAERDLHRVLGYEMDRFTPFTAENVFWHCQIERRDRSRAVLELSLSLVPKHKLLPLTELLSQVGVAPTWLEAQTTAGPVRRITLGEARQVSNHGRAWKLAAGVAACLAIVALATPFVTQSLALSRVDQRIAGLQSLVTEAETLRRRLAAGTANADIIASERARAGTVLQVLAALTGILPDDTVLTDLTLNHGQLNIGGQSSSAAQLIPALAADPTIRNPSFAAPVTRAADGQGDVFAIRAELSP